MSQANPNVHGTSSPTFRSALLWVCFALLCAGPMIWPGDAPFLNDEPNLLHKAIFYNRTPTSGYGVPLPFTPAPLGLRGSHGLYYGPLGIWIYQILLLITRDPVVMVALRTLLVSTTTGAALWWLARSMRVGPWLAVVTMLSPWLWFYSRQLWDNSFCIPLSAMALAGYADFLISKRGWALGIAAACASAAILIHLMALALAVPLAAHFFVFEARSSWRVKSLIIGIVVLMNLLAWPYWKYMLHGHQPMFDDAKSGWDGWWFPLLGGHHLTATGLGGLLGEHWVRSMPGGVRYLVLAGQIVSSVAYLAVWIGVVLATRRSLRVLRRPKEASPVDHLAFVGLAILVCQCILDGVQAAYDQPHYFNATWCAFVIFAWLAFDWASRWRMFSRVALPCYAGALMAVLVVALVKIHHDGGARVLTYGTVLSDQLAAAQKADEYSPDSPRDVLYTQWAKFPGAPVVFRELGFSPPAARGKRHLVIRYRDAFADDAHIVVEVLPQ